MNALQVAKIIRGVYNAFIPNSAAFAGGCIRDDILGRPIIDYDVWVEYSGKADIKELHILLHRFNGWSVELLSEGYETNDTRIQCVFSLTKLGEQKVDVIFTNWSIENCVKAFPSSISQVWAHNDVDILKTEAFEKTVENKEILFTNDEECKHVRKMKEYFPEYKHTHINQEK